MKTKVRKVDYDMLPEFVQNDLDEAGYEREEIESWSPKQVFGKYLEWNGILGSYQDDFWHAAFGIRKAVVSDE